VIDKFTTVSNYFSKETSINTPLFSCGKDMCICTRIEDGMVKNPLKNNLTYRMGK
jgi:hypothetical protein